MKDFIQVYNKYIQDNSKFLVKQIKIKNMHYLYIYKVQINFSLLNIKIEQY